MKPRAVTPDHLGETTALPATAPLIVFDGVCVLCSGFAQWVMARDTGRQFWFTTAQGPIGQGLYRELGLDPVNFETNLLVVDGIAYGKLDAFIEITARLGGVWRAVSILRILPERLSDRLYDAVANNRYRLFGKREACWLPARDGADRIV